MRLVDLFTRRSTQRKMDTLELFKEVFGGRATWSGKAITIEAALQMSVVLCCARVIAESVAVLPWKVLRLADGQLSVDREHPLARLISYRPNPVQSPFEFIETLMLHLVLAGNGFVWTPRVGLARTVDQLWILEPAWVTVRYEFGGVPSYVLRIPGWQERVLGHDEVWHVRALSWCSYVGMQPVQLARETLGLGMAIEEGQARAFGRGLRGAGYISVEGSLKDEQHKQLSEWLARHSGSANTDVPMILDRAAKWISASMTNVEAQVLEQRKHQIEEVCRFMRVMPLMVGHTTAGSSTYGSVEQMFIAHDVHTTGPWVRRLEMSADATLLSEADYRDGRYTKFNEKAAQRMTATDQIAYLCSAAESGIMTRNEARAKLDLNPLEGLDAPLTPANMNAGASPDASGKGDEGV